MTALLRLLLCVALSLIPYTNGQIIYDIVPEAVTNNPKYDGWPSAYELEYFNITGQVYLNITTGDNYNVKIQIRLPNDPYTTSVCDTLVDGTQTCSDTSHDWSLISVDLSNANLTFGAGISSISQPIITQADEYVVEFEIADVFSKYFNTSDFNSSVVTSEETILVTIPAYIKSGDANSLYEIIIRTTIEDEEEEDSTKVRKVGPYMTAFISAAPASAVEAGDIVSYTVRSQHVDSISTENATNVQVSIQFKLAPIYFIGQKMFFLNDYLFIQAMC